MGFEESERARAADFQDATDWEGERGGNGWIVPVAAVADCTKFLLHDDHAFHLMPGHVAEVSILTGLGRRKVNLGGAIGRDEDPFQSFRPKFRSPGTSHVEAFSRKQSDRYDGMEFQIVVFEHEPRVAIVMEDRAFRFELPPLNHHDHGFFAGLICAQRHGRAEPTYREQE